MNITYRISLYDYGRYHWVVLINNKAVSMGDEATFQDCLDVMSDMKHGPTGERFVPHAEDSRWNKIQVSEIDSNQF